MSEPTIPPTRRTFLIGAAATAAATASPNFSLGLTMNSTPHSFPSLLRSPNLARAFGPGGEVVLHRAKEAGTWNSSGFQLSLQLAGDSLKIVLSESQLVSRIQLRWEGDLKGIDKYLGDHWERSYGDLEWRGEVPGRILPWYFLAFDGKKTSGYGVRTGAGAMCFWTADSEGISLWLDIRSGGIPVELNGRQLTLATIVEHEGMDRETPFQVAQQLCKKMCPHPLQTLEPIYGTNDWNYAYGNNSAKLISSVSSLISELSTNSENRPYSVIDEGWAMGPFTGNFGHGPWVGNPRFGDMGEFATHLRSLGVRPGIWFRPLSPLPDSPASWRLSRDSAFLDPTVPEVNEHVAMHIKRLVDWGYEMIKHDFTTFDLLGLWGFEMGASPTKDGWKLHDPTKTNAEVIIDLYQTIRTAAGNAKLIGCNTVGHLSAGTHEIQRIGDDTSGRSWNRNRRMGVNTLAFRAAQNRQFFISDPDIVAITKEVPWSLVKQWLELVSLSGSALFVAIEPEVITETHRSALKQALHVASSHNSIGEPIDWLESDCPRDWLLNGKHHSFAWMGETGAWPFGD